MLPQVRLFKFLLLLPLCFLLGACHSQAQYVHFIKNPDILKQTLITCANSQSHLCQTARASAQAMNNFASLASAKRSVLMQAQSAGSVANMNVQTKAQVFRAETEVEECFGQNIMFAQIRLVNLETSLKQAKTSADRAKIKSQLNYQQHLVDAMLALISVYEPH